MEKEVQSDLNFFEKNIFRIYKKKSQITSLHHLQIPHGLATIVA
jgi:hypothetical protein